jgi:hypothetical protein
MKRKITWLVPLVIACTFLGLVTPALGAGPNVVYVAYNGVDTSVYCNRYYPCKTITKAMSVVAANGTVNITTSGTFDSITITKGLTLSADPGVLADVPTIQVSTDINSGPVILRGLYSSMGGITFVAGTELLVVDCFSPGGLIFSPSTALAVLK